MITFISFQKNINILLVRLNEFYKYFLLIYLSLFHKQSEKENNNLFHIIHLFRKIINEIVISLHFRLQLSKPTIRVFDVTDNKL